MLSSQGSSTIGLPTSPRERAHADGKKSLREERGITQHLPHVVDGIHAAATLVPPSSLPRSSHAVRPLASTQTRDTP